MFNDKVIREDAWNLIDKLADEDTKEQLALHDLYYDICMKIFNHRTKKGWSQKQLAGVLGVSQAMVSKLESGTYNPTVEQLWKISRKLGWNFKIVLDDQEESSLKIWGETHSSETLNQNELVQESSPKYRGQGT
jgi:transcriptional regulator with XRE-family HTH domain